jgi:3'-phosphoadenosine 5'-phosphosulfate (PAPS) 3'-phosphatase
MQSSSDSVPASRVSSPHPMGDPRLECAMLAAARGAQVARVVLSWPDGRHCESKPDGSPVSAADLAIQIAVTWTIRERFGASDHIVGEEGASSVSMPGGRTLLDRAVRALRDAFGSECPKDPEALLLEESTLTADSWPRDWWTIDPIDGTKGFRSGRHFAICVARVEDSVPMVGALSCPTMPRSGDPMEMQPTGDSGTLYAALAGSGAWSVDGQRYMGGDADAVRLSRPADRPAQRGEGSPWIVCDSIEGGDRAERMRGVVSRAGFPWTTISLDSQCKYALVADGRADAFMRVPSTKGRSETAWDHVAGLVICAEAGAFAGDLNGAEVRCANGPDLTRSRGVLACDRAIADAIVRAAS